MPADTHLAIVPAETSSSLASSAWETVCCFLVIRLSCLNPVSGAVYGHESRGELPAFFWVGWGPLDDLFKRGWWGRSSSRHHFRPAHRLRHHYRRRSHRLHSHPRRSHRRWASPPLSV